MHSLYFVSVIRSHRTRGSPTSPTLQPSRGFRPVCGMHLEVKKNTVGTPQFQNVFIQSFPTVHDAMNE